MPFTPPYIGFYTPGDLIYGLRTTRSKLVIHFGAAIIAGGSGVQTVDQYRKSLVLLRPKAERTTWRQFMRDNEAHPRYSGYAHLVRRYDNDEEAFSAAEASAALQNAAWRAKSKFGLEWTLRGNRGHIHFVLDDIDMGAVVTKTHNFTDPLTGNVLAQDLPRGKAPDDARDKERTITHSELRWIYRNRANPLVSGGIQFWLSVHGAIAPCGPPWDNAALNTTLPSAAVMSWQHAWRIYHPTTERNAF
jgi:hypothetical protein